MSLAMNSPSDLDMVWARLLVEASFGVGFTEKSVVVVCFGDADVD